MKYKILLLLCLALSTLVLSTPISAEAPRLLATIKQSVAVQSSPSANSEALGTLKAGAKLYLSGRDATGWLFFYYYKKPAWIPADSVQVEGDLGVLPLVSPDGTIVPDAGIRLKAYAIEPPVPAPGQPFRIRLTLENNGGIDAGMFAVATTFTSGAFVMVNVPHLGAGEAGEVLLDAPGEGVTGQHEITVALDVNHQLGTSGGDKLPKLTYWVDAPRLVQTTVRIPAYTNLDLYGGSPDVAFDGQYLSAMAGAQLLMLPDTVRLSEVHLDLLRASDGAAPTTLTPGMLIAVLTSERQFGVVRVAKVEADAVTVEFFIYSAKVG